MTAIGKNAEPDSNKERVFFEIKKDSFIAVIPVLISFLEEQEGGINDLWSLPDLITEFTSNQDMTIWAGVYNNELEGLLVAQIVRTPKSTTAYIQAANTKNIRRYLPLLKSFEKWACFQGCDVVAFEGASAWHKLLKKQGYCTPTIMLRKNIKTLWSN